MVVKPREEWCRGCKSVPVIIRTRSKGLCPACRKAKQRDYHRVYNIAHPRKQFKKNPTLKTVRMKRRVAITSSDFMHAPPEKAERWLKQILSGNMIHAR